MLRKQVIVALRRCGNSLSLWERIESRLCSKGTEKCQEKEEEGIVRTNKNKGKPVGSWRCPRQACSMKAPPRVVQSLIFLVFGVHMVSAEEQEVQAQHRIKRDLGQIPRGVDVRWKRMPQWNTCGWKWDEGVLF